MKRYVILFFAFAIMIAGLLVWMQKSCSTQEQLIQGRSISSWIRDVEIGGFPGETNLAYDVLISAGPKIMPSLCCLLEAGESPNDMVMRLPSSIVPVKTKDRYANESEVLVKKAKATWVMSVIAYRNPGAPEVQPAVPPLIAALRSGSREVRAYAAQALATIGRAASNAVPALISKTTDEDSGVRLSAVDALGRVGVSTPEVIVALTTAQSDANTDVSMIAGKALQTLQKITPAANEDK